MADGDNLEKRQLPASAKKKRTNPLHGSDTSWKIKALKRKKKRPREKGLSPFEKEKPSTANSEPKKGRAERHKRHEEKK